LLKAAQGGDSRAAFDVGVCYRDGVGIEANASEAFSWFNQGSSTGNLQAMFALAKCYEKGLGVVVDQHQALALYSQVSRNDAGELGARARSREESLRNAMDNAGGKGLSGWFKRLFGAAPSGSTSAISKKTERVAVQSSIRKDCRQDNVETVLWVDRSERPALMCVEWKSTGRTFELHDEGHAVTIGRSGCDITLDTNNYHISRCHARFVFDAGRVFLVDNASSNGTYLNGECIASNQWYPLSLGDTFSLADEVFLVKKPSENG